MELEDLRTTWKNIATPKTSENEIKKLLQENKHPVLRKIRKQIIIELIGWIAFLVTYYSLFDGADKPIFINLILVASVLTPITHNLYAYILHRGLVDQSNFREALKRFISRLKTYALLSIISRTIYCSGLLLFFTYNIRFNNFKYSILTVLAFVVLVQILILLKIWNKRINKLNQTLAELD
ncbi:hypothetical protein [Pedobacter arcticus]|uniref:hypothetical protein n=1 Tax=Pedobacter arcticus TaxID=752140 RepID=UPI000314871B|nr:hypothetical protein [Pedobacter arcticus]